MAAPTYATDLATITLCDSGSFFEFTGYTAGTIQGVPEQDYFIQDSGSGGCVSSTCKTTLNSIGFDYGSGVTVPTDGAVFFWQVCWVPNSMDTFANGGQRCFIGTDASNFKGWKSGGNDFSPNPYGGWKNVAIDPTVTADYTAGSVTTLNVFGVGLYLPTTYPTKGAMFGMDAVRYGRGEFRVAVGDSGTPATFAGMATANDALSARWGLFQAGAGSYLWKGLITLGYGSAVYFSDANKVILTDDTPRVGAAFNKVDIKQSGSTVIMTNCIFQSLGTTSRGTWVTTDNATVTLTGCTFVDWATFSFLSNTSVPGCTFRRADQITAPGCDMVGARVEQSRVAADSSAVVWNVATDPDGLLDDMYFSIGANAHHAIEFGSSTPSEITLNGWETSGFNASNGNNDSTIYNNRGGALTINVVGGSGNFSYKNGSGASTTIVIDPITTTITVRDVNTSALIENARVLLIAADATGDLPYQESVSIVSSGGTATVTHTGHGMASGDFAYIQGANEADYNGCFEITVTGVDAYTYTISGSPSSPATGTILSTGGIFNTLTNSSGIVTDSRSITNDQPVVGRVRLGTGTSLYKNSPVSGTIDATTGLAVTVYLIPDD